MEIESSVTDPLAEVRHRSPKLAGSDIDYGILPDLTGFSIKLVWILGYGLLMRGIGDSGITPHRFSMLEVIGRNAGLQQTQLANALALSRPATTLAIDFWEARGCVERRRLPGDRRSFGVFATEKGLQELRQLRLVMREADIALTSDLTADEVNQLHRLLRKIHK